jgi:hypothetical protein
MYVAPALLRVARSGMGGWRTLDRAEDEPTLDETIYVYERVSDAEFGKVFAYADYKYYHTQPTQDEARDAKAWAAWCKSQLARTAAAPTEGRTVFDEMHVNTRDENGVKQPLDEETARALAEVGKAIVKKFTQNRMEGTDARPAPTRQR